LDVGNSESESQSRGEKRCSSSEGTGGQFQKSKPLPIQNVGPKKGRQLGESNCSEILPSLGKES